MHESAVTHGSAADISAAQRVDALERLHPIGLPRID